MKTRRTTRHLLTLIVVLGALFVLPTPASSSASDSWWTVGQVRAFLLSPNGIAVTDTSQPDQPNFVLRFGRLAAGVIIPRGAATTVNGQKGWRAFSVTGSAHDLLTGDDLRASFTFRPLGSPSSPAYAITGFRGPQPNTSQPSFPIRAAFVYSWFPEGWTQHNIHPFSRYEPSAGYYDSGNPALIRQEVAAMQYGNIAVGIYSYWTPGTGNESADRFPSFLRLSRQTPLRWAIYYEQEGISNPSVEEIRADLIHFRDAYATKPAYLKINGRFVVYVYADASDGCGMADRWKQANTVNAYIVLKAFRGYRACTSQPDSWHEYSVGRDEYSIPPPNDYVGPLQSYMISPGFNARDNRAPARPRDLGRWRHDIRDMVSSNAPWQLILTFNEWNEGTSVEDSSAWATPSGYGAYLDALHAIKSPSTRT
jgi:hypothetical protein